MVDVRELRACFARKGVTQKQVADAIGISEKTLISRMKRGSFGTDEAQRMVDFLGIENPAAIFFAPSLTCQVK